MLKISLLPLMILFLFNLVQDPKSELDKFWEEASRTVQEGDFKGYADTFHKDAVLVNGISGNSYPISTALDGWKQGFEDTKAGKMKASVEFRFSERLHSETTAYETGIFKYSSQNKGEEQSTVYIHLEALLTKASGEWKLLMEHQVSVATEDEWNSIK
ncbi:MAG: nuclear transport factor 2 family protein [Balneola sp.]|nr:nuclear transport factor 2 family protein [Balneola sp.]MBO6650358.1 nuclear transport factor 2 family protein [Balneola sp.]MBO6710245.1 nuclear transport factor 2 family protein [Balneola sp.]MBO6798930.1 nuclear transport factor 2 family protein [Balneola sp.]MBO6870044.1 nuclear transport factor 2 family protein [Balneola sp.]